MGQVSYDFWVARHLGIKYGIGFWSLYSVDFFCPTPTSISGVWYSTVPHTTNRRVFEMTLRKSCECCNQEDRGTFGNILPQFRRKGRKYSLVEAIMASAYLARYELELKKKYPQERKSAKRWRKKNYNDISKRKINIEIFYWHFRKCKATIKTC